MARVDADSQGRVVRFVTGADEAMAAHPQAAASLSFDEASNAALAADLRRSTDLYTLTGGVLKKAGVTQTVAADSAGAADRKAIQANAPALFAALRAGTATSAQVQRVLAFLLRQFLQG